MTHKISFSYTAWSMWKKCPLAYKFAKIDKVPVPDKPAFEKGRRVHRAMEQYVKGESDARPKEAGQFTTLADGLRAVPDELKIVEQQMAFDVDQRPCAWFGKNAFYRFIWDAAVLDDAKQPQHIEMADWKTGRPYGAYDEQMQLFSIPAFLLYPSLQSFAGNLVYLEHGDTVRTVYTRHQFENGLNDLWRGNASMMAADQSFQPKPSKEACKFCDFHPSKGGPCTVGV